MSSFKAGQLWLYVLVVLFLVIGVGVLTQAKTLHVANNGVDTMTCGDKKSPCRSISIAMDNANPGDKIIVGPGHYGDLDGDTDFNDPGEETGPNQGCTCMIKVNKQLTIESRNGAAATVLDAGGASINVVRIEASGVVFGKKKKGFTLTHAGFDGLEIEGGTTGVRVTGNLASANDNGFDFSGSGHLLTGNVASANSGHGFFFRGDGHVLTGNLASANSGHGFSFRGSEHVLSGNIANANGNSGFEVDSGSGYILSGNATLGNRNFGIIIVPGASATITKNNIFGNHGSCDGVSNLGLFNNSGGTINATNNFWGSPNGPGRNPANALCEGVGSTTTFVPFATREFKVKVKVLDELPSELMPSVTLPVTPKYRSNSQLSIYTLTGQLIAIVSDQTQLALTTSHLPNGLYLAVKVYANGRRELVKLMVKR